MVTVKPPTDTATFSRIVKCNGFAFVINETQVKVKNYFLHKPVSYAGYLHKFSSGTLVAVYQLCD